MSGRYDHILRWATTGLKVLMVILAIKAVFTGKEVWIYSGIFCAAFAFAPSLVRRCTGLSLPIALEFLLFLALFLHVGGGALGIYSMFGAWDIVTHLVSTFMLALVGITLVYLANHHWGFMRMAPSMVVLTTMVIAMTLGFAWEGMEWAADRLFDIRAQDGISDTVMDLVMDAVGGLAASVLAVRWVGNGTLARMTSELGEVLSIRDSVSEPSPIPR